MFVLGKHVIFSNCIILFPQVHLSVKFAYEYAYWYYRQYLCQKPNKRKNILLFYFLKTPQQNIDDREEDADDDDRHRCIYRKNIYCKRILIAIIEVETHAYEAQ